MTETSPHNPEHDSQSTYKILNTNRYLEVITHEQGVVPTETVRSGDSEGLRAKYVMRTEQLIDTIEHGFEHTNETGEVEPAAADAVFYLDKSARPVQWLVSSFWNVFAENQNEEPETHFLNLHAQEGPGGARPSHEDVVHQVESGLFDTEITEMRNIFPGLDGKNILVVDEVTVSGATEELAYRLFRRAFPEANVKSASWMVAGQRSDERGNLYPVEIPVWYRKDHETGRGIAPVDVLYSEQSESSAQREGAHILSTRPEEPDLDAAQLRREIKQLAHDVKSGKQPIIPYFDETEFPEKYTGLKVRQAPTSERGPSLYS